MTSLIWLTSAAIPPRVGRVPTPSDLSPDQLQLLRILRAATQSSTRNFRNGPTYQHLTHALGHIGIRNVDELLQSLSPAYLVFAAPLADSVGILPTARGWHAADPHAPELHAGLIPAVRRCYDLFHQFKPPSPTEARPIKLSPQDLWPDDPLGSKAKLFVVGLLLEVERVGKVTWTGDPASPWRIELDTGIRRFARVGDYDSFLEASKRVPLAIAS